MDTVLSSTEMKILWQIVICLLLTVTRTNASKVRGHFQCSRPPQYIQENMDKATTCQQADLPTVEGGYFNCSGYSVGDKCNLTCKNGYYPPSSKTTICEEKSKFKAYWSDENFQCSVISCQMVELPIVKAGYFNCSGYSVGDKCTLTCDDGYYSPSSNETVCEERSEFKAYWSDGNFTCSEIRCFKADLSDVANGFFTCLYHPNSFQVNYICNLSCEDDFYPFPSNQSVCKAGEGAQGGQWFGANLCRQIICEEWNEWKGKQYRFIHSRQTWIDSRKECQGDDADLVSIQDEEENHFVHKMLLKCVSSDIDWSGANIGLNDIKTEAKENTFLCRAQPNGWLTELRFPITYSHLFPETCFQLSTADYDSPKVSCGAWEWGDNTTATLRNWYNNEPNEEQTEDCAAMRKDSGQWFNIPCESHVTWKRPAVCERSKP